MNMYRTIEVIKVNEIISFLKNTIFKSLSFNYLLKIVYLIEVKFYQKNTVIFK